MCIDDWDTANVIRAAGGERSRVSETDIYRQLKNALARRAPFQRNLVVRVENYAAVGFPDVHLTATPGIEAWVELKTLESDFVIRVRNTQLLWLDSRARLGRFRDFVLAADSAHVAVYPAARVLRAWRDVREDVLRLPRVPASRTPLRPLPASLAPNRRSGWDETVDFLFTSDVESLYHV